MESSSMSTNPSRARVGRAVVLIGHGAPATDCPPEWVGELMQLEWRRGHNPSVARRAEELDAKIRQWPRTPHNDPYKVGVERLAQALRPLVPGVRVAVGYNEFCAPSVGEVMDDVIAGGARHVVVVPSMLTPGGLHAERDIPKALEPARARHPGITIDYVWPFDVHAMARLLADHIAPYATSRRPAASRS